MAIATMLKNTRRAVPAKKPVPTDTYSGRVASRLRTLREDRGWTVADLAERLNRLLPEEKRIANSTLHAWDNGSRTADPNYYPALAKVFGLTVLGFLPGK